MDELPYDLDATRTPQKLFDVLNRKYSFCIDLFADENTTKVGTYFSRGSNGGLGAFGAEWPRLIADGWPLGQPGCVGWSFGNPPYGRGQLPRFVTKCLEQVRRGSAIVALIPATPGTEWFNDGILRRCDTMDGATVDEPETYGNGTKVLSGYRLNMQGSGYRQTVTWLRGRVPFDPPIGYPPEKDWNPPATDSIIWTLSPSPSLR